MNKQDFDNFKTEKAQVTPISIDNLKDKSPRTLLYGYDTNRATFHVYIDPQDHQIHVMYYLPVGPMDNERVLVLSHTSGPAGGVESNEAYTPNKRLYPESCDLEFCRLLRDADVSLPFTTYDEKGEARVERHNGFAGHIYHSGLDVAVKMEDHLPFDRKEMPEAGLLDQMIRTACYALNVPFRGQGYPEVILVAEADVKAISAKMLEYFESMGPAGKQYLCDIEMAISEKVIKWYGFSAIHNQYPGLPGAYVIEIDYAQCSEFIEQPDSVQYTSEDGIRALQGVYEGRPYFILLRSRGASDIIIHLFGPTEEFVRKVLENNRLQEVAKQA